MAIPETNRLGEGSTGGAGAGCLEEAGGVKLNADVANKRFSPRGATAAITAALIAIADLLGFMFLSLHCFGVFLWRFLEREMAIDELET